MSSRWKISVAAFTLTELLVVIAIIGSLAALLVPAVKNGMNAAKTGKAVSNLKQTGSLLISYASENNNRWPVAIDWELFFKGSGAWFQASLADYSGHKFDFTKTYPLPDLYYDPILRREREHPWGSFGVNATLIPDDGNCLRRFGQKQGVPVLSIPKPSQKVIYCSVGAGQNSANYDSNWGFDGETFAQRGVSPSVEGPDPRHSGRAVALFADGHVEKLDVKNMDQATRRKYFTLDP